MNAPIVFVGMETSGAFRRRFQALGHETYSCDVLPSEDGGEEMAYSTDGLPLGRHLVGDVYEVLEDLRANDLWPDLAIFHITCTFLTGSAEWAFKDPDYSKYPGVGYHQKVSETTLTGQARRDKREEAKQEFVKIMMLPIKRKIVENPVGALSSIRSPSQIIQPYEFGDDASKKTCFWYIGKDGEMLQDMRVPVDPVRRVSGRIVNGRERWGNQTDSGQNRLSPGADRWKDRSRTFPHTADAVAKHWSSRACYNWSYDL